MISFISPHERETSSMSKVLNLKNGETVFNTFPRLSRSLCFGDAHDTVS